MLVCTTANATSDLTKAPLLQVFHELQVQKYDIGTLSPFFLSLVHVFTSRPQYGCFLSYTRLILL